MPDASKCSNGGVKSYAASLNRVANIALKSSERSDPIIAQF